MHGSIGPDESSPSGRKSARLIVVHEGSEVVGGKDTHHSPPTASSNRIRAHHHDQEVTAERSLWNGHTLRWALTLLAVIATLTVLLLPIRRSVVASGATASGSIILVVPPHDSPAEPVPFEGMPPPAAEQSTLAVPSDATSTPLRIKKSAGAVVVSPRSRSPVGTSPQTVPKYMEQLAAHFNFDLSQSFGHRTLEAALGPLGVGITVLERYRRESDDGVERNVRSRKVQDIRLLGTEYIDPRYGLTNILLSVASMLAYAGVDDRAVVFPYKSPIQIGHLLDLSETEFMLRPVNTLIITEAEFRSSNISKGVRVKKLGITMGTRTAAGSMDGKTAKGALITQMFAMKDSRRHKFFIQGAFFLRFPFRAIAPFDACFYIRRMVYTRSIRNSAATLLRQIRDKGVTKLMAVHLRLEFDATILDVNAGKVSVSEIARFFNEDLIPIATAASLEAIYISAGKLKPEVMEVLRNGVGGFPVYFKDDFKGLEVVPEGRQSITTSHTAAAMDTLIISHSAIAVVFLGSTFAVSVASHRCPTPAAGVSASYTTFFPGNETVQRGDVANGTTPPLVGPKPADPLLGTPPPEPPVGSGGNGSAVHSFFGYRFLTVKSEEDGTPSSSSRQVVRFSRLRYISCDRPLGTQCFYHGLTPEDEARSRGGKQPLLGDELTLDGDPPAAAQ